MDNRFSQFSGFACDNDTLMYQIITEAGFSPPKESYNPIRPPATMFHIAATIIRPTGHGIGIKAGRHLNDAFDLSLQIIRDSFIRIDRKHPVFSRILQGTIFLWPKSGPVCFIDLVGVLAADGNRLIAAAGIQDTREWMILRS